MNYLEKKLFFYLDLPTWTYIKDDNNYFNEEGNNIIENTEKIVHY